MDGPCGESDPQGAISQPNPQNLPTGPLFGERVSADVTGDPEMKSSRISQTGCHHTDMCLHERLTEEKHTGRRACGDEAEAWVTWSWWGDLGWGRARQPERTLGPLSLCGLLHRGRAHPRHQ